MSNYSEYEKEQLEIDKAEENTVSYNFVDLDPEGELTRQLADERKKGRTRMLVAGLAAGLMLTIGVGYYVADAKANSANAGISYGYQTAYGNSNGTGSAQYAVAGSTGAVTGSGGGGCCGGGGSSAGGGGCGASAGGGSLSTASLADLEKQALAEYDKETGAKDVTAKAGDFGCHIQIDISDKTGKIIRSYGYQGGPLYVIK